MINLRAWCKHSYLLIRVLKRDPIKAGNLAQQVSSTFMTNNLYCQCGHILCFSVNHVQVKGTINQGDFYKSHDQFILMYNRIPKTGSSSMLLMFHAIRVSYYKVGFIDICKKDYSKILPRGPGSENKRMKSCVFLPAAERRMQVFTLFSHSGTPERPFS